MEYSSFLNACSNGDIDFVKKCIEDGIDCTIESNLVEYFGYDLYATASIFCASINYHLDIVILLLEAGGNIKDCCWIDYNKVKEIDEAQDLKELSIHLLDNCPIIRYWAEKKMRRL